MSQIGLSGLDDDVAPQTPVNRLKSQHQAEAFSPFSFRSSEDSPRLMLPSSPSVILFSGPADRGFERIHDESFHKPFYRSRPSPERSSRWLPQPRSR